MHEKVFSISADYRVVRAEFTQIWVGVIREENTIIAGFFGLPLGPGVPNALGFPCSYQKHGCGFTITFVCCAHLRWVPKAFIVNERNENQEMPSKERKKTIEGRWKVKSSNSGRFGSMFRIGVEFWNEIYFWLSFLDSTYNRAIAFFIIGTNSSSSKLHITLCV